MQARIRQLLFLEVVRIQFGHLKRPETDTNLMLHHQVGQLRTVDEDDAFDRTGKFDCLRSKR